MIYLLKFGASFVLPPGIFFVAFIIVAIYAWKHHQRKVSGCIVFITMIFYLMSLPLVSEKLLGSLESVYEPPAIPEGDVIVMLGGGALPDTPDVDGQGSLCSSPSSRLLAAVRLYRQYNLPILLSGGQVYADSGQEALIAKRVLTSLGVPESDILVESHSLNTRQNAEYTAQIMKEHNLNRPIVVTSAFHMERAMLNFTKAGLSAQAYPTDYMINREHKFHYIKLAPSVNALNDTVIFCQEKLRTFVTRYLEK